MVTGGVQRNKRQGKPTQLVKQQPVTLDQECRSVIRLEGFQESVAL